MRYTQEQISTALVLLKATGSPDEVIRILGYPSNPMLYHWRKKYPEYYDIPIQKHWKQAPIELKHSVIKRCLIQGEPVKLVAEEIGYTPSLIYKWIREYREKGYFSHMKKTTANIDVTVYVLHELVLMHCELHIITVIFFYFYSCFMSKFRGLRP